MGVDTPKKELEMARKRKLSFGIINITMHPHTPERYVELLKAADKNKLLTSLGHNQSALINNVGFMNAGDRAPDSPVRGTLIKFNDIDVQGAWFDVVNNKEADEADIAKVSIPDHLKPNMMSFEFVFFPKKHLLFYECFYKSNKLSPAMAMKALNGILNNPLLQESFGVIEITHVPEQDGLDTALASKRINNLVLRITRPNADHFSKIEQQYLAKMNKQNVAEIIEEHKAVKGEFLVIDQETKNKAKIAESNGYVEMKGLDGDNKPVHYSTLSHPRVETGYYDINIDTPLSFLFKMARDIINKMKN
jgi:hypothetical protein